MARNTDNCPKCNSERVHRSRVRSLFERLRKRWSNKRLHRCHDCGWRGWREESHLEHYQEIESEFAPPDLNQIDAAVPMRRPAGNARREQS